MKYSGFRRDVKLHVLTFSTSGQRQVTTFCTCAMTSRKKSHVSGCRRQAGDVYCLRRLISERLHVCFATEYVISSRQLEITCCTSYVNCKKKDLKEIGKGAINSATHCKTVNLKLLRHMFSRKACRLSSNKKKTRQKLRVNICNRCEAVENDEQVKRGIGAASLWLRMKR